jgi:hypothetical protein
MSRRPHGGGEKWRAVRAALARLGMQAPARQVVEALAGYGIAVSEALVNRVKFEAVRRPPAGPGDGTTRPAPRPARRPRPNKVPRGRRG